MRYPFLEPCIKSFKWRAGKNDGEWRSISVDDRLRLPDDDHNYIWEVRGKWQLEEYDDTPWDVYTGFTISADDYSGVWRQMCDTVDLNDHDYDDVVWEIQLIGIDLTSEGPRIINNTYRGG